MKLAVIGSRSFEDGRLLSSVLSSAKTPISCIVSGGASGADKLAEAWAKENGVATEIFLPNYAMHGGKRAPLFRNEQIIKAADCVVAFWDGISTGTQHALMCAERHGKPAKVIRFQPAAVAEPRKPVWYETYRGGVSLVISNRAELAASVECWQRVLGLVQRLPADERNEQLSNGRVFVALGTEPETVVAFTPEKWNPKTVTLTLRYDFVAADLPGDGNFWYI